jgi:hypothetical protein
MELQLDHFHRLNQLGCAFRPTPPLVFLTPLLGDTFRPFKVEVVGAMVSNIFSFVGVFHIRGEFLGKSSARFSHDFLRKRIQNAPILRSLSTVLYRNNKHNFYILSHSLAANIWSPFPSSTLEKTFAISKSNNRTIDHGSMGTMVLWSIAVSLDFE